MSKMNKVIGELSEINHNVNVSDLDKITIDLHDGTLYIYSRFYLFRNTIFELDAISRVLLKNNCSFYLSATRYGFPAVVVSSVGVE